MNILIIGNGGREHALAWKVKQSPLASRVFVAPGNAGTSLEPGIENVCIAATDISSLINFATKNQVGLTIVGPEAPLAAGIVDQFTSEQLVCFGPTQAAAQLETSKAFSKDFMRNHHIPTAAYACFDDLQSAITYIQRSIFPLVIKADGLAAGKGVVITNNVSEAMTTVEHMLSGKSLAGAGKRVIIEAFLTGEEASFIVITDGKHAIPLASTQDHKTRDNGDIGPNTGGMGAYSPAAIITPELQNIIMNSIIYPTLEGMAAAGTPYKGFLYAGLMMMQDLQPKVLEFNCRLGDPETQPILMRLKSDLVETCLAVAENRLQSMTLSWDPRPALGVVLTAKGYPDDYPTGELIEGLSTTTEPDAKIFHAGTQLKDGKVVTAGGRVVCVTSLGKTVSDAQSKAYDLVKHVHWKNQYYRTDIGYRAIQRETIWTSNTNRQQHPGQN